jgi:cell division transport system permease protein
MAVKRKKLGSYPYYSVVFSITMALFVIGVFGILVIFANRLSTIIKENIELHVYLDRELNEDEKQVILKKFFSKEYVAIKNNHRQVFHISKDSAAAQFIRDTGEDFVKFLGDNPLRDAYIIKINSQYSDQFILKAIRTELENIEGVFEVTYVETLVESINKNVNKISLILLSFATILILVVYILINSSIRLALYSQRFLIRSMQLVGATSFFIQMPFMGRAFLHGLLGGLFASGLLYGILQYAYTQIPELQVLENLEEILLLNTALLVLGGGLGFFSSYIAIKKYLNMSLNELY